jgi:hypothetical protein
MDEEAADAIIDHLRGASVSACGAALGRLLVRYADMDKATFVRDCGVPDEMLPVAVEKLGFLTTLAVLQTFATPKETSGIDKTLASLIHIKLTQVAGVDR